MAASASVAAPSDDCNQTADMDLRIRGCTQFIKSSKDAKQIAIAYFLRGDAHRQKQAYDLAINDFNTALQKNPAYANAYRLRGYTYLTKGDWERGIADCAKSISLDPNDGRAYSCRADAYFTGKQYRQAAADYVKSVGLVSPEFKGRELRLRWLSYVNLKDYGPAVDDLRMIAKDFPRFLAERDSARIYETIREATKAKRDADIVELIRYLKQADYRGEDPRQLYDGFDTFLLDSLVRLGRIEEAAQVLPELKRYESFLRLRVDNRYAQLRTFPAAAALLQPQDFAPRALAAAQKAAARYPRHLDAQGALVRALQLNGRYDEAVRLGESLDLSAFDKKPEDEAWLRNAIADALQAQGKFASVKAVLEPLMSLNAAEHSFVVNQQINLGGLLLWQGQFTEAIETARKAKGHSSVYGEMWIKSVEICSFAKLGNRSEADAILPELLKTADTNYRSVLRALICLDQTDQAASTLTSILQSEGDRATALLDLQTCPENSRRPSVAREHRAALMKLRDRPDVRKVLDSLGVIATETIACGDRYGNV